MPTATPASDRVAGAPEEGSEGDAFGAQLGVEHRHLQGRLGHAVALELAKAPRDAGGVEVAGIPQRRHQEAFERQPGGLDVLGGVARLGAGDALAPAFAHVGLHAHEQRFAGALGPLSGAESRATSGRRARRSSTACSFTVRAIVLPGGSKGTKEPGCS